MKPLIFLMTLGFTLLSFNFQSELKFTKDELTGKFKPSEHPGFSKIKTEFSTKKDLYLRTEALNAFEKMYADASKAGISLKIISATRNFEHQKKIWTDKWLKFSRIKDENKRAEHILRFSSMPGTSRHHWGTDIDINALNDDYFTEGHGKTEYEWLCENAHKYGFYQPYTNKNSGRTGYEEEKWHWTYLPLSSQMLEQYKKLITYEDITGFAGSHTAPGIHAIELYVKGVELPLISDEKE